MSVRQLNGNGIWYVDIRVGANGKRVRRSTGTRDRDQAEIIERTMRSMNRGVTPRDRALAILDAMLPREDQSLAIADAQRELVATIDAMGISLSNMERAFRINNLGQFAVWAADHIKGRTLADVTADVAWTYSEHLGEIGQSAKTRNNRVAALGWAWRMLERRGKVTGNPWANARTQAKADEESHGRAFTDAELARIMAEAEKAGHEWAGVVTVALYTGLRMRDVECLRWRGDADKGLVADLATKTIYGTPSKTSRHKIRVAIPMHARVVAALEKAAAAAVDGEEYAFPWRAAHPTKNRAAPGDVHFADILARAGVTAAKGEKVSFHSLRHTFVSRLAAAGVAEAVRMRLAGHTDAATHAIYTHGDAGERDAINALQ